MFNLFFCMQFKENFVLFGFCNTNSRFQEVLKLIKTKLIMTWSLLFSLKISSWRVCVCMGEGGIFFTLNFHWFIVIISLTLIGIYGYFCVGHMTLNHNVL